MQRELTNGQARLLAVLMLADGRRVDPDDLAYRVGYRGSGRHRSLRMAALRLRNLGVRCVDVGGRPDVPSGKPVGMRLTDLPPDWTLEDVLAAIHRIQREWSLRTSPIRMIA